MKSFQEFVSEKKKGDPCWDGYEQFGTKDKDGKQVPNCIPIEEIDLGFGLEINEDSTAASTSTGGVANPDAKPLFNKSKFMGHDCIDVDDKTYSTCIKGKVPFKRWAGYVEDESLRAEMKSMYQKKSKILVRNERTGGMVFIK